MKESRTKYSPRFKAKVAFEALRHRDTIAALSKRYDVHPNLVSRWRNTLILNLKHAFDQTTARQTKTGSPKLHEKLRQLKEVNDTLKKKATRVSLTKRRAMIEPDHPLSIRRQCDLLGIHRSGLYYQQIKKKRRPTHRAAA